MNYMLDINILFGTSEFSAALHLFYRHIMTLARSYGWSKVVLPLALDRHKHGAIRSPLDRYVWKIAHDYQVSYRNDATVQSSQMLAGTNCQRPPSLSSHN